MPDAQIDWVRQWYDTQYAPIRHMLILTVHVSCFVYSTGERLGLALVIPCQLIVMIGLVRFQYSTNLSCSELLCHSVSL